MSIKIENHIETMSENSDFSDAESEFENSTIDTEVLDDKEINTTDSLSLKKLPIINNFNFEKCTDNPHCIMIGKRGSGKTCFIREMMYKLYENKKVDEFFVISPTSRTDKSIYDFIDKVYYEYKAPLIDNLMNKQRENTANGKKNRVMVIFDDCLESESSFKNHSLLELLYNGRHYNISYIISMQFPMKRFSDSKIMFDYVFLMNQNNVLIKNNTIKNTLYKYYGGMFPTFETFDKIFNELTQDFSSMIISNSGFEKVFWYKANKNTNIHKLPTCLLSDTINSDIHVTSDDASGSFPIRKSDELVISNKISVVDILLNLNDKIITKLKTTQNANTILKLLKNTNNMLDYIE